jgi:3-oxoacyl-[acyl-carrier-protein] synthase I
MNVACDAGLDARMGIVDRIKQLLLSALEEPLRQLPATARQVECWIGLPEPRPGLPSDIGEQVSTAVSRTFGMAPSMIRMLPQGHASGLIGMQAAAHSMSSGSLEVCIVAGVDSYQDPQTLEWLDDRRLLMSSVNRNGFPPGEGAGACLLASRRAAEHFSLPVLGNIAAATTAFEQHAIRSDGVCIGEGLSSALNGVVSGLRIPEEAITETYCDLNGERYRNEERTYAVLRVSEAFVDVNDCECPADCWGDVGAASGPLFASLAVAASRRGYAKGNRPVLWAGSESGHRSAVILNLGHE